MYSKAKETPHRKENSICAVYRRDPALPDEHLENCLEIGWFIQKYIVLNSKIVLSLSDKDLMGGGPGEQRAQHCVLHFTPTAPFRHEQRHAQIPLARTVHQGMTQTAGP